MKDQNQSIKVCADCGGQRVWVSKPQGGITGDYWMCPNGCDMTEKQKRAAMRAADPNSTDAEATEAMKEAILGPEGKPVLAQVIRMPNKPELYEMITTQDYKVLEETEEHLIVARKNANVSESDIEKVR